MKKVAIVGAGWVGMPLALSLIARGYGVTASKTTPDGVEAARMSGIECYALQLAPHIIADPQDLDALFAVDALVLTLPASRTLVGADSYCQAVQEVVNSALAYGVPRVIFLSSTSVYGEGAGSRRESSPLTPVSPAGISLVEMENWLHQLPGIAVDTLRLAGLVGPSRHPGRFLAGKTDLPGGDQGVNLVHQADVISAIQLLLQLPRAGHRYNLCAPLHPAKRDYYPAMARELGLVEPQYRPTGDETAGKLVDGSLICRELGFEYQYPDPARMPMM